jgi:anti-sigma factor RsiW
VTSSGLVIPGGICCQDLVELVTAYLDGALSSDDDERMTNHLEFCGACVEYLEQVRATTRLAKVAAIELELRPNRDTLLHTFREFTEGG